MAGSQTKSERDADRLLAEGEKVGYVAADRIFAIFDPTEVEEIDELVARLHRRGVRIVDSQQDGVRLSRDKARRQPGAERVDALSAYLREISALPSLDREAEVLLATQFHEGVARAMSAVSDARIFGEHLLKAASRIHRGDAAAWEVIDRVRFSQKSDPEQIHVVFEQWISTVRALHMEEERVRKQIRRRGASTEKVASLSTRIRAIRHEMQQVISQMPLEQRFMEKIAGQMVQIHRRLEGVQREKSSLSVELGVDPKSLGREIGKRKRGLEVTDPVFVSLRDLERRYRNLRRRIRRLEKRAHMQEEELRSAVRRYRDGMLQAQRARDALIMSAQKLVLSSARYYGRRLAGSGMEVADLISAGNIGLIRAVELFDPARGNRFSTFAGHWVRHTMIRTIHTQSRTVYVPPHIRQQMSKILAMENELLQKHGRSPSDDELAQASHIEIPRLRHTLQSFGRVSSIDRPLDPNDSGSATYGDVLAADGETPHEALEGEERRKMVRQLADRLEGREKTIVFLRMGWDGEEPRTLAEIGGVFGISRQRVEQLEKRALGRLRRWARAAGLTEPPV